MSRTGWLALGGVLLGVVFAVQGGEYGTSDYYALKRQERALRVEVTDLRETVDSLERVATALERDPKVQERVARESFGMLRPGEFLYRIVPEEDSATRDRGGAPPDDSAR